MGLVAEPKKEGLDEESEALMSPLMRESGLAIIKDVRPFTIHILSFTALVLQWIFHCGLVINGFPFLFSLHEGINEARRWCPMRLR